MAQLFSSLIEHAQKVYPQLEIVLREDWSSKTPDYRKTIRQNLAAHLRRQGIAPSEDLLDLNKFPQATGLNISVSHCPQAGGWAQIPQPYILGFDIEDLERDMNKAVARVSPPNEVEEAPSAAALWVAKEALFKALRFTLQSQAQIHSWQQIGPSLWQFSNHQSPAGKGFVAVENHLILGLFVVPA